MNEPPPQEESLTDEFRDLAKNLVTILQTAWDRPERRKLQDELETGLTELSSTIKREAKAAVESPAGQRIRSDIEGMGEKVRSGQVEAKVHDELVGALKTLNAELKKAATHLSSSPAEQDEKPAQQQETPTENTGAGNPDEGG